MLIFTLCLSNQALAKCNEQARDEAQKLRTSAASEADPDEAIYLLRNSAQICEDYITWMELGRRESKLNSAAAAADYFSRARDMYSPNDKGELSTGKLRRLGIANTLLAGALYDNDEIADALHALDAAKRYFATYRPMQPARVLQLQARIDDAMSTASAPTLTRSLTLQRAGSARGVGIRQKPDAIDDEFAIEDMTLLMEEQFEELADDQTMVMAQVQGNSTTANLDSGAQVDTAPADSTNTASLITDSDLGRESVESSSSRLNIQVLFKFDSADIDASGALQVEKLADALNALRLPANTPITIVGHTDVNGNANYNLSLSERRAVSVADQIRSKVRNIAVKPIGMGETQLRYTGNSPDDHRRNRRVEIIIN